MKWIKTIKYKAMGNKKGTRSKRVPYIKSRIIIYSAQDGMLRFRSLLSHGQNRHH
jgi:hypothetical protein